MTALLEATGISKRFAGITALDDVSVRVDAGELVALIGPNGAGKTTLFDCLAGVVRPDAGTVRFDGRDLRGLPPYERSRLGLARTFQQIELFAGLTVLEHLLVADRAQRYRGAFMRDLLARSRPTAEELDRCAAVLDLVGLVADADRPAESLTLGRGRVVWPGRWCVSPGCCSSTSPRPASMAPRRMRWRSCSSRCAAGTTPPSCCASTTSRSSSAWPRAPMSSTPAG
jgi:branched-chain amino acid transport system ATP-binding protein